MAKKTYNPEETGIVPGEAVPTVEADPTPAAEIPAYLSRKDEDKRCEEGFWCYIGPSLPGLLQHGTILPGSRAEAWQAAAAAIEAQSLVKSLIVSGDSLPLDRLKAKTPGTALYENCRKVAGKLGGGMDGAGNV